MVTPRKLRPQGTKQCSQCGKVKDAIEFSWRWREARLTSRCLECRRNAYHENPTRNRERAAAYYKGNREAVLEQNKRERRANIAKHLLSAAKRRARERGVPCTISVEDCRVPTHCPVLGIELRVNDGTAAGNSPTLDCILPYVGYVPGNVVVVSHRANTIKSDASVAELAYVLRYYSRLLGKALNGKAAA